MTYKLSCYIQCCSGGPCPQVHAYPSGPFEFFYPSGELRARGTFIASRQHVDTSCEGGDTTTRGVPSAESKAWDESGKPVAVNVSVLMQELLPLSPSGV